PGPPRRPASGWSATAQSRLSGNRIGPGSRPTYKRNSPALDQGRLPGKSRPAKSLLAVADIYAFLDSHGISYQRHDHPAVFTVEDVKQLRLPIDGTQTKNLFLRDEKGRKHFLVVVGHDKQVDLRGLSAAIGSSKLSFASPDRLRTHLGIEPGSVSMLALVNDSSHS